MFKQDTALRYAKALFNLSGSEEKLAALEQALILLKQDSKIMQFFSSPQIKQEQKEQTLEKMLGKDFDRQILTYLNFLFKKQRFNYLPDIVKAYQQLMHEKLEILEARLITATPVDVDTKANLKEKLEKIYRKKLKIKEEIHSSLVGGGILIIDNHLIDFSIQEKLVRLKKDLLSIKV